jgi:spermidine/putrescine transport system permease protein
VGLVVTRDHATTPASAREWLTKTDLSPLLVVPIVVFELLAFVAPFLLLIRISLYENARGQPYVPASFTLGNYQAILTDSYIHGRFFTTLEMALVATVVTLVLGGYFAYVVWRAEGWLKVFLLVATVLPLLTTLVVKLYAWVLLLAPLGTINNVLVAVGVIEAPIILMNNRFGAVVGLVHTTFPYTVLPVYALLETPERATADAAPAHGAG